MRNPTPFVQRMNAAGMMPIFFHPDGQVCQDLLYAAYEGGVRAIEMVNRGKEARFIFPKIREAVDKLPGMSLGMGTIFHAQDAEVYIDLGAEFIVAPVMNAALGEFLAEKKVPWIPGCGTVSEVFFAREIGAELVKIYPANILSPAFVSAVHAVLPKVELIPTGGVEPTYESLKSWFDAGVLCVGMGSRLFKKELIQKRDFAEIQRQVRQTMDIIQSIRRSKD